MSMCKLFGTIHDLMSRITIRGEVGLSRNEFSERMLRLCLLSMRLVFDQARREDSRKHLQAHVDSGLLSIDELNALDGKPAKPLIVWTWINKYFRLLCQAGEIA